MTELFNKLWLLNYTESLKSWKIEELLRETPIFDIKEKGNPLFMRIDHVLEVK
jgi:hypothetical protein